MKKHVIIGSRSSRLALVQAESVLSELKLAHPGIKFELTKVVTTGDRHRHIPLNQMPVEGSFVKEIEDDLLGGRIDIAVHSLKDMPTQISPELSLAAVTMRLDPRDVLVSGGKKLSELTPNSVIGTGSPRRVAQLLDYRPDLKVKGIRGNINTRVGKVSSGEVDGVILAAAGLIRLGWEDRITEYLPLEHFLPSAGQGALAIEMRAGEDEMQTLVRSLHHQPTGQSVSAERTFLQAMGGGCSAAIACLGTVSGNTLKLQAMAVGRDGLIYDSEEGNTSTPEQLAERLANRMLEMGALPSGAREEKG